LFFSLIVRLAAIALPWPTVGPYTTLIAGHGTNIKKPELLPYRAMIVDILAKTKTLIEHGKSLQDVMAAKMTGAYDAMPTGVA
jgi:hypothetical protein